LNSRDAVVPVENHVQQDVERFTMPDDKIGRISEFESFSDTRCLFIC